MIKELYTTKTTPVPQVISVQIYVKISSQFNVLLDLIETRQMQ